MAKHRHALPLLQDRLFITDGGLETTLIFHEGIELPEFAAFVLMDNEQGRTILNVYFSRYLAIAIEHKVGFILESPTWRASNGWGEKIGYSPEALEKINMDSIRLLSGLRDAHETEQTPVVISGAIGPRGDGYVTGEKMTARQAEAYHTVQIETFSRSDADLVTAFTLNYAEEAIGIAHAAAAAQIPAVIGFTVETDGRLPYGQPLDEAISEVDAVTDNTPAYYMINCAHPTHFKDVLAAGDVWTNRIRAIRANASEKSHAELDEAEELDAGNPEALGMQCQELRSLLKNLTVLGGCCGTDNRHIAAISKHWKKTGTDHDYFPNAGNHV